MNDLTGTVLLTCAHGAARSRIAAAYFNAHPPTGWHATTAAAEHPNQHLNPAVTHLSRYQRRPADLWHNSIRVAGPAERRDDSGRAGPSIALRLVLLNRPSGVCGR